jgi:dienelactone hydrolase
MMRAMRLSPATFAAFLAAAAPNASAQELPADEWLRQPVSDVTFRTYLDFFAYNAELPFDPQIIDSTAEQGVVREHLSYVSTAGVRVTAHLFRPSTPSSGPRPAVILLHGGTANGKNGGYIGPLARLLARDQWTVLAIDLLHFGERTTPLLATFTNEEKAERLYNEPATYLEFVTQTVKDVSRGYDYLVKARDVDPRRVALVGISRGAVLSAIAGAVDRRLAGVGLLHVGHMIIQERGHRPAACPANYVARISPRPLLFINTENDALFPAETSIRPFQRLVSGHPVQVRWTEGPHGFLSSDDRSAVLEWLRAFPR